MIGIRKYPSLPARGAWVEIGVKKLLEINNDSRSPHGERGLKFGMLSAKSNVGTGSLPARGAWVEIRNVAIYH